jgi:hemerythrin-like metal-binding protein
MPLIDVDGYLQLGIPDMDIVHAEFAALVNRVAAAQGKEFTDLFSQLLAHTRAHFAAEEELMRRTEFPGRQEHVAEHGRVLGEMERFADRLAAGKTIFARAYIEDRIPDWFALHTQTLDYALATYLRAKGVPGWAAEIPGRGSSRLQPGELDCLRLIARGGDGASKPCTDTMLRHLAELGFVERVPTQCLPLEMPRTALRLTPLGSAELNPD